MNSGKQFDFHKVFVISAIVVGVGFFLFSLIFARVIDKPEMKTTEMGIPDQKREAVLESPGRSTIQEPKLPSAADIEAAIAALENLDATRRNKGIESSGDAANSETLFTDYSDETLLSYEEERKQRRERIRNSPEFKAIKEKSRLHAMEWNAWGDVERPAKDAWEAYMRNPFIVFGMTKAEANMRSAEAEWKGWSDEELEFMRQEGERLRQEAETEYAEWSAVWEEYKLQQREFSRQLRDMLKEK